VVKVRLEVAQAAVCAAVLSGCSRTDLLLGDVGPQDGSADDGGFPASPPQGPCNAVVQEHAMEGRNHVAICSYVDYLTKPPNSGNHYPIWLAYKSYATPMPQGFWVHNLEHGSIVLSYNCALNDGHVGCQGDVDAAQQMLDALPTDPLCTAAGEGVSHRTVMTPDPNLDVPFAASAWTWTLRADCFDPVAFQAFAMAHYGMGPEEICGNGEDFSGQIPQGCGDDQ
jgi:hypothetical protein